MTAPAAPPLSLGGFLSAVQGFLERYVALPSEHEAVAVALWVAHAWLVERFETSPILEITSAEMRSGKTRLLDVLDLLVPNPFRVVVPSEALVYTVLAQRPRPTMLLDEADAIFGPRMADKYEGIRAILNSGNRMGTPVLRVRLEGRRREVEPFDVFGPKAIAGIGRLPDTVADRAITIGLRRRAPGERVERFRQRTATAEAAAIVCDWSAVTLVTGVTVPEELNDRAADGWEPLLMIADAAGAPWPDRARRSAIALATGEEPPSSVGSLLLSDIQRAFGDGSFLSTDELLSRLHAFEDAPWGDWYGKPLTARALGRLLEPYRIRPRQQRVGDDRTRGYFRADLADAWARYARRPRTETPGTSAQGDSSPEAVWRADELRDEPPHPQDGRPGRPGDQAARRPRPGWAQAAPVGDPSPAQPGTRGDLDAVPDDTAQDGRRPTWTCPAGLGHHPGLRGDGSVYCATCAMDMVDRPGFWW